MRTFLVLLAFTLLSACAKSGRDEVTAEIKGATISVDYGRPSKRERVIFGGLVPWGEVWRTGANKATHLETDRTLTFATLVVPPGEYTLYTIPEPDGGVLIFNRETGQSGTEYHPDQDLGRVEMAISTLPESVETFTMQVEETPTGGEIKLLWDTTAFTIPFTVQE